MRKAKEQISFHLIILPKTIPIYKLAIKAKQHKLLTKNIMYYTFVKIIRRNPRHSEK